MTSDKALRILSTIPFFSTLDTNTLEQVARATIRRSYQANEIVFLEGDPCMGLYVVEAGWLKAAKVSASGREQIIRFVGPGEIFNEIGVLSGKENQVTVETLEPVQLWIVQRNNLLRLMDQDPILCRQISQNLAQRILHALDLVVDLSLHSVESRLARFLLDQAEDDHVHRRSWTTQAAIAARIGTVPVVINRAFHNFIEEDLIQLEKDQIRILDSQGLLAKIDT